jgi:hypothetical protein
MQLYRMIDFLTGLMSRAWRAYMDDAHFDPEAMLAEITPDRRPPEA